MINRYEIKYIVTLLISITALTAFAQPARQDTTLVFARPGYDKDPIRAKLKRTVTRNDSLWVVALLGRKNMPFETISYADEQLSVRQGPYALYGNGQVIETGSYDKGYKNGEWKQYNNTGKAIATFNFRWDKLYGPYTIFWENGAARETGNYVNGKNVGKRLLFYSDGKLAADELYNEKGLIKAAYFDAEGKNLDQIPKLIN